VVVCHTKRDGRKNEGIEYRHPYELVDAHVYTKYFFHKKEYRVLVFNNKVIGIYSKVLDDENNWDLVKLQMRGFNEIIEQCEKASRAVGMDFVGFDVVANTRKDFKILEANSGPIITDEAIEAFKKFFN
jgi:glutathione synthase/RimK-type ligase-like ATP-grasp enzyme